jgi:DNA-directed RNA polymerase
MSKIISLDKDFINKANKKIQFTAFCMAIKNYELDNNFLVKLPVFLDATCSGIQHLSAMLQDINLGANVNLLSKTEDEDVNDLYQTFVDPINESINKFGKENTMYSSLKNVKLDRKIIKTPIMTGVYSVTVDGIFRQLTKKFKKTKVMHPTEKTKKGNPRYNTYYDVPTKNGGTKKILYIDVYRIAEIIKNASFDAYPSLKEIYSYFIESAKLMVELKIPIV